MRCFQLAICALLSLTLTTSAQDKATDEKPIEVTVADGQFKLSATSQWEKVQPRSNMLDAEFKIPKVDGDERDGRLTIMGAGGSVAANIDRWYGQFSSSDGGAIERKDATIMKVSGQTIHLVDISGTFADSMRGPMGPKTKRDNYRMLGSIIETEKAGKYFIKLYGPKSTIDANADHYKAFLNSLKPVGGDTVFTVADGNIQFSATSEWTKVQPRSSMLAAEFKINRTEGDEADGRLTIMRSGGSIEANLDRWVGQFKNADGTPIEDAKPTEIKVDDCTVHQLRLSGTFGDSMRGPMGPKTDRKNYQMIGSIIETESEGNYFVKFYGPANTVKANANAYQSLIKSMKIKD